MNTKQVKEELIKSEVRIDQITKNNEIYTIRKGFYYTHGFTTEKYINQVKRVFPNAEIIDAGEIWLPFRGGASISRQSHWFVKFKLNEG